jgi:uncharacterized protein (TIGR02391 family)
MSRKVFGHRRWHELAARIQSEAKGLGFSGRPVANLDDRSWLNLYDKIVTDPPVRGVSRGLFRDGHYARAVEEAFKCLNNSVKSKSGLSSRDGADLMRRAFSANEPVLTFSDRTSISEQDEQRGYMEIYAGSMMGIRNPRAHDHRLDDHPRMALQLLVLANHLMDKLEQATNRQV